MTGSNATMKFGLPSLVLLTALLQACGPGDEMGPSDGLTLVVEIVSGGVALDPNGYLLVSADTAVQLVSNGTHVIEFSVAPEALWITDVRANCSLAGDTLLPIEPEDGFASTLLSVQCGQLFELAIGTRAGVKLVEEFSDVAVTLTSRVADEISWNPNRGSLAYRESGGEVLIYAFPDSSEVTVVDCDSSISSLGWSADGEWLSLLSRRCGQGGLSSATAYSPAVGTNLNTSQALDVVEMGLWSPSNQFLAFSVVDDDSATTDLYVGFADGRNPFQLTNLPGEERSPAFSANGSYVIFSSDLNGTFDIYRVFLQTGGIEQLTGIRDGDETTPRVSPIGTRFAYLLDGAGQQASVLMVEALNDPEGRAVSVPGVDVQGFVWSPESEYIAYEALVDGVTQIFVVHIESGENRGVSGLDAHSPAWSPDGTRIAFLSGAQGGDVHVVNVNGSGLSTVGARVDGFGDAVGFAWRPAN